MTRVLLISSFTADSHVGGMTSAFVLRRLGIDVTFMPTTLFGRHPGWGAPGGSVTQTEQLKQLWTAIEAQLSIRSPFEAVMTGYMGEVGHVTLAAQIIDAIKPRFVVVDPVMGDGLTSEGLYISENRAEAICDLLIPRANIVTPNLWEWRYMTGSLRDDPMPSLCALTGVDETLVTSVEQENRIGARLFESGQRHSIFHKRFERVPHGGGDALAAAYLARRLRNEKPQDAFAASVSSIFEVMTMASESDAGELPIIRAQGALTQATPLTLTSETDDD